MPSRYHSDRSMILVSKNKIDRVANQPAPKYKWQCHQELHHMNSFNQTKCGWLNQDISSEFHHFDRSAIMSALKKFGLVFSWCIKNSGQSSLKILHILQDLFEQKSPIFFWPDSIYPLLMLMILYSLLHILMGGIWGDLILHHIYNTANFGPLVPIQRLIIGQ